MTSVLAHVIQREHGGPTLTVIELQASVPCIVDDPAVPNDRAECSCPLRSFEKTDCHLHLGRIRWAADGGEGIQSCSRLLLCPDQELSGAFGHRETIRCGLEPGAGRGRTALNHRGRNPQGSGQRRRIGARVPPAERFDLGRVGR